MPLRYYKLTEVVVPEPSPNEFRIATAAVLLCALCGGTIDSSGGPGHGAICAPCGDAIKTGRARGAIKWGAE